MIILIGIWNYGNHLKISGHDFTIGETTLSKIVAGKDFAVTIQYESVSTIWDGSY